MGAFRDPDGFRAQKGAGKLAKRCVRVQICTRAQVGPCLVACVCGCGSACVSPARLRRICAAQLLWSVPAHRGPRVLPSVHRGHGPLLPGGRAAGQGPGTWGRAFPRGVHLAARSSYPRVADSKRGLHEGTLSPSPSQNTRARGHPVHRLVELGLHGDLRAMDRHHVQAQPGNWKNTMKNKSQTRSYLVTKVGESKAHHVSPRIPEPRSSRIHLTGPAM